MGGSCGYIKNNCNYGFAPNFTPGRCTCLCLTKLDHTGDQHNCLADCKDTVKAANDVCSKTPLDSCTATNPYGPDASCGYGVIKKKKNKTCRQCRCQVENGVCGIGAHDDHCTPSQNWGIDEGLEDDDTLTISVMMYSWSGILLTLLFCHNMLTTLSVKDTVSV